MSVELQIGGSSCAEAVLGEEEIITLCEAVLHSEEISRPCELSLSYVDEDEMAALNLDWRDVQGPTDVLSFECEHPSDADLLADEPCMLGDIVLAPSYIVRQAQSFGTTLADEHRLLLVHGMLHLLGYDHEQDGDAALMQAKEDALLAALPTDGSLSAIVLARHRDEELA